MNNKKSIIALLLVAIIGIVGLTVAYFSNSTSITNEFETSEYGTDVTETFTSPTGWQPGDETPKVLTVKNTGEVDEAVRVKVEESWKSKNNTDLPLTQGNNVAAIINWTNTDDWTKVDVDGEDYYYYYYNYKLAPDEETSELLDKVTFNPLINASTTCTDSIGTNGETIRSCKSNESGYDGATYTLKFTIETVQYNKYASAWNTGSTITLLDEKPEPPEPPKPASEYLAENATNPSTITLYNDANADKGKMFTFTHGTGANTVTETRYIGNEPNNYVYFNCADPVEGQEYNYATSCEVWRILGVFDVEREIDDEENPGEKKTITEQRMKLVRGSSIKNDYWDTNYKNDWTIATLKTYLNATYYNGLQSSAKDMIDEAKYFLGAVSYNSNAAARFGTTEKIYTEERGNVKCGSCNNNNTKLTWYGKIGLMYPSDVFMVYAGGVNTTCYSNPYGCSIYAYTGWIYSNNSHTWFLSSKAGDSDRVLRLYDGFLNYSGVMYDQVSGVRPVVYLSADVQIFDRDGSEGNPYKLKK